MSFFTVIRCDRCGATLRVDGGGLTSVDQLVNAALVCGWKAAGKKDLCTKCATETHETHEKGGRV